VLRFICDLLDVVRFVVSRSWPGWRATRTGIIRSGARLRQPRERTRRITHFT